MTVPFHQRLLRAARVYRDTPQMPSRLAELAAHLQRDLGLAAAVKSAPDIQTLVAQGANLLHRLQDAASCCGAQQAQDAPAMLARGFTLGTSARPYRLFVPAKLPAAPALIVMLHGCSQSPEDFAAGTRMNKLAGARGCLVLYPEQIKSANQQRCWNWFSPADQRRGQGEPALIAGMTRAVIAEFNVDPARVYIAGLSAGGAKAAIMGAAYPDLYAAIAVHSGLACGAAHDMVSAFTAMRQGRTGQGNLTMPTIIFHGDRDATVNPANADAVAALLPGLEPAQTERGQVPGGLAYTRSVRLGPNQRPLLEQWTVHGAGHAWSGGSSTGSFTEPLGPDASQEMLRFFLAANRS